MGHYFLDILYFLIQSEENILGVIKENVTDLVNRIETKVCDRFKAFVYINSTSVGLYLDFLSLSFILSFIFISPILSLKSIS